MRTDGYTNALALYVVGGICALVIGIAYVIIIALYAAIGPPPLSVGPLLLYLARNSSRWSWIIGLSVLTDFLFVPLAASIYFVRRRVNRFLVCLAAACILLFVILDLAVTWTNYVAAMALGSAYLNASTDAQKNVILGAAEPIGAILHSKLLFVYNTLTLAVGILLTGVCVLHSSFGKASAYAGVAAGSVGVLAVVSSFFTGSLSGAIILASFLTTLWVFILGYQFCRRGMAIHARTFQGSSNATARTG